MKHYFRHIQCHFIGSGALYFSKLHSVSFSALSCACAAVLLTACGGGGGDQAAESAQVAGPAAAGAENSILLAASGQGLAHGKGHTTTPTTDTTTPTTDTTTPTTGTTTPTTGTTTPTTGTTTPTTGTTTPTTGTTSGTSPTTTAYTAANHLYVATTGSDSNPGTASAPFRTIAKASAVAKADTVVHVASGTYAGSFTTSTSGSAGANIVYVSDVKWGAKLVPSSSTGDTTGWQVTGNYIVIDGFDIDGQSSLGWRRGIHATGSHIVVKNNNVHHIAKQSPCDDNGGAGITMDGYFGGAFHEVRNNVTHHIGPGGPNGCGVYHGIYIASYDFTVSNNLTYQNSGLGIHLNHDWGRGYVVNNTVFRNGQGILAEGNDFVNATAAGPVTIENNLVYDNNPNGPVNAGYIRGIGVAYTLVSGNVIANNYSYNNRDIEISMATGKGTTSGNITSGLPGFVNYLNDGSGDYHLVSTSQLIDRGLVAYAPQTDLAGTTRPQGSGIDIGAYEYKAP